jgi:tetratricopeptide (TPR) repeat protein
VPAWAAAKAPEPTAAQRLVAALQAQLDALLKEGTDLALYPRYEALLAEAARAAEEHQADPASAAFYRIAARCYEVLGKHVEKEAAFARYIDVLVAHNKARAAAELCREADDLLARRELFVAAKILELMVAKFPDGPEAAAALYRLGTCHLWMDHYEPAEMALAQVIERWPGTPHAVQARLRLARAYIAQGKYLAAADLLERFVAQTPDSPERPAALFTAALARHLAGDYYPALLAYQHLLREAPESAYGPLARAALVKLRADVIVRASK